MEDTTEQAAAVVRDGIRRTDPVVRMRDALAHSDTMRALALAQLRARYPDRSTLALVEMLLDQNLIPPALQSAGR